jgi:hypothetical protein
MPPESSVRLFAMSVTSRSQDATELLNWGVGRSGTEVPRVSECFT